MCVDLICRALLCSTLFNYVFLIPWLVILRTPHRRLYRLSCGNLNISEERFDSLNMAGIIGDKVAIVLFNLAPYFALRLAG